MSQPPRPRTTVTGTGVITYARPAVFGGMTLLRGEEFTGYYRAHLHTTYVVGVVMQGRLGLVVRDRGFVATPGCLLLLNPHEVHEEFSVHPMGWSFRYFFPGEEVFRALLGAAPWFPDPILHDARLARRFARLHGALLEDSGRPEPALEATLADTFRRLAAASSEPAQRPAGPRRQMLRVRDHLHEAPSDALRLESLALVGGLSRFHLVRSFHRELGLPPHAYYEQLRIARCKDLLHDRRRLSEVAFLMKYSDQSHFTRQFGGTAGVSPGKYAHMVGAPGRRLALPARAQLRSSLSGLPG